MSGFTGRSRKMGHDRPRRTDLRAHFGGQFAKLLAALLGERFVARALDDHEIEGFVNTEPARFQQRVNGMVRQPRPADRGGLVLVVAGRVRADFLGNALYMVVEAVVVIKVAVADEQNAPRRFVVELLNVRPDDDVPFDRTGCLRQ